MKELVLSETFKINEQLLGIPSAVFGLMKSVVSVRKPLTNCNSEFNVITVVLMNNGKQ